MWILYLNDMRSPKIEILVPVARAATREVLVAFLERERVEVYHEDRNDGLHWGKSYRKGGPLEWYNRPYDFEFDKHFIEFEPKLLEYIEEYGVTAAEVASIRAGVMKKVPEVDHG